MTKEPKNVYEQLAKIVKKYGYKDLNADFINGYLTAIACSPNSIDWDEWFDYLFVDESSKLRKWQESDDSETAFDMLLDAYDVLVFNLQESKFIPYISKESENMTHEDTKDWTAGFLYGTTLWDQEILTSDKELMRFTTSMHIYDNSDMIQDSGPKGIEKAANIQKEMYKNKPYYIISEIVMSLYFRAKHNNIEFLYPELVKALKEITEYDIKPEYVHGYISALICSPVKIKVDVWIAGLWKFFGNPVYNSIHHEVDFKNALSKLYKNLSSEAYNLNVRVQLTDSEDIMGTTAVWAEGFIRGMDLWEIDADLKERFMTEYKIMEYYALKGNVGDDFFDDYYEAEERINEKEPLTNIYYSFFELHASFSRDEYSFEPIINESKTGRNDPCPCGSGKKYKKCCGK